MRGGPPAPTSPTARPRPRKKAVATPAAKASSVAPSSNPGLPAAASKAPQQEIIQLKAEIARQQAVIARQQAELEEGSSQHAELRAENEELNARLTMARCKVDPQKTALIRWAANEIISAMGSRGERRKLDLVLLAAKGFAEGSKTFTFDRPMAAPEVASSDTVATGRRAVVETSVPPPQEASGPPMPTAPSQPAKALEGSVEMDDLATLKARVALLREEAEAKDAPEHPPPMPHVQAPRAGSCHCRRPRSRRPRC